MDFDLTKEQQLLSDAVQRFVAKEYSFAAREAVLDSKEGWSREIWAKLAELGLLGLQMPEELLPAMAAGERIAVPAHGEPGARDDLARVATTAARPGEGFVLNGGKAVVMHAASADALLVSARTSGAPDERRGISLFIVPRGAPGVSLQTYRTLDGQRASDVA